MIVPPVPTPPTTKSGLFGTLFGRTEEQCFDITLPAQTIENALTAGGKVQEYILKSNVWQMQAFHELETKGSNKN